MRSWITSATVVAALFLGGCGTFNAHDVEYRSPFDAEDGAESAPNTAVAPPAPVPAIPVYATPEPPRPCDVIGVLDFHTDATSEDKGFDELRREAARLGADAVISAEFEHGDDGGKSHLSGVVIRYKTLDPRPFVVLGPIDIATPEDDDDKGFDQLRAQARAMGADKVVNVHFEHGEEGGMSHLTGVAVRYVSGG